MANFDFGTLVTDRTQADVDYLNELTARIIDGTASAADRAAFESDLRGAYNASDMIRVGNAVTAIVQELNTLGISVTAPMKTDWTVNDIPTLEQLSAYLAGVATVYAAIPIAGYTPALPESMDALTFEGANAIERSLAAVKATIEKIKAAFLYSGTLYCGMTTQFISGGSL